MRSPRLALIAAAVLMIEAAALAVIVALEAVQLFSGQATSLPTALGLVALTGIGAAALALFSVGVARGRSWARSGGIVLHVLAILMAFAALTTTPSLPLVAAALGIPGVLGFALLIASARAEGRTADTPDAGESASDTSSPR